MESQAVDTWKIVSLSPLALWALVLLSLALVLGVVFAAWGVRKEPSRLRRWLLWAFRLAAGLVALVFLFEPGIRRMQVAKVKNRVAILVDRSASMSFPSAPGGESRSVAVADALEKLGPAMAALKEKYSFDVFGVDPELAPIAVETLRTQPPTAGRTDLLSVIRALKAEESASTRKLAGVVWFTDGADNTDLAQGLTSRAKASLADLGVPVSTVAVGQGGLKDLAIDAVRVDDFAFVRNSVTAEVEVHARGFGGQTVPVVLRREGQTVATKTVMFTEDDNAQVVKFTFTPDQTGRFVYTVSMPVYPDEAVAENNARSFSLKVIRDRVRVLLVAGRPTWDERFLRGLLRQDANVDLISFYILRNSADESGAYDERTELSLIPFPHEQIFREKISTFDVIMILNFGNEDRGVALTAYDNDLREYVKNGGALVFVGGDHSFGESPTAVNPFADVLPVEAAGAADLSVFKPRLTADGQRHPITALATGTLSTPAAWAELPPLPGANMTRAKPGATVLLEHPFAIVGGKSAPLLAIWEYGRGRSLALMTDSSWYWAFTSHVNGAPSRSYERYWNNAIRWLVRDPELTTLGVTSDPPSVEPGKPVSISVVARTPDYQAAPGAIIDVELRSADDNKVVGTQQVTAGSDGTVRVEFPPPAPGAYKVVGRASKDGRSLGESSDAVAVRAVGPELADARVNSALLKELAAAAKGSFFESPGAVSLSDLPLTEPPLVEVGRSKDQPLWDRWYWLALMVLIVGTEWAMRRRFGYI